MIKPEKLDNLQEQIYASNVFFNLFYDRLDPSWINSEEADTVRAYFIAGWKASKEYNE